MRHIYSKYIWSGHGTAAVLLTNESIMTLTNVDKDVVRHMVSQGHDGSVSISKRIFYSELSNILKDVSWRVWIYAYTSH